MPISRFSLLLLEPREIYFEDFSVTFSGSDLECSQQRGRLRLCSRSVMFEPIDLKYPLTRINFSNCTSVNHECDVITINCNQIVEMLANNIVSPFSCEKRNFVFQFSFHYATSKDCFHRLDQLHRASTLPPKEHQEMIEAIVYSRHSRVNFDPCWLEDPHESILFEARVTQVSPLVSNPGRVVLSSARLYYQPYNCEPWPVLKIRLTDIEQVVKRRYLLQNSAIEIYYKEQCSIKYLFLAVDNQSLCDELLKKLEQKIQPFPAIETATLQWQHGILSNYDYLLLLNSLADRSFNDLTQYPVFPWVIIDYTSETLDLDDPSIYRDLSKPIGALNSGRLKQLLERFKDMPEPRFLYGSHYMAPGFVLFYLARQFPQLVLCLHGGRFDHPDRMFNSLHQTWANVFKGASDYKELVPEFYGHEGDFLVNYMGINFGTRSDGRPIQDVELPPWAKTPQELTSKLRQALESEHVSKHLHLWIDLIFGHLQKGPNAIEANNLFHPLCYEGSVDLCSIRDPVVRHTYEIQILEFGQIPRQLFTKPHPLRLSGLIATAILTNDKEQLQLGEWSQEELSNLQLDSIFQGHKKRITDVTFSDDSTAISVSLDGFLKVYKLTEGKQILSVNPVESSPLTACLNIPNSSQVILGTLQNEVALYQIDCCRLECVAQVHDDNITSLGIGHDGSNIILASGSSDSFVKLWRLRQDANSSSYRFRPTSDLLTELEHNSSVFSLNFNPTGDRIATGSKEGEVQIWDVHSGQLLHSLSGHDKEVSGVKFSPDGSKLISAGRDGLLQVFQVNTEAPTIFARTVEKCEDFRCVAWDGFSILLGTAEGSLLLFDVIEFKIVKKMNAHTGPLTCIGVSSKGDTVLTAGDDARVCVWKPKPQPS